MEKEMAVMQEKKPWYLSKTIWANLVMGVLALVFPKFGEIMSEELMAGMFMVVNIFLRSITKDKLELK